MQPTADELQLNRKTNMLLALTNLSLQKQPFLYGKTGMVLRIHRLGMYKCMNVLVWETRQTWTFTERGDLYSVYP